MPIAPLQKLTVDALTDHTATVIFVHVRCNLSDALCAF